MAKKKKREEVNRMLSTLNYCFNYVDCYGHENDYDHDFVISHLNDVIEQILKDKENKNATRE